MSTSTPSEKNPLECNSTKDPSSEQLFQIILDGSTSFQLTMFFPIPFVVLMVIMFLDLTCYSIKNSVRWKETVLKIWILSAYPVLGTINMVGIFAPRTAIVAEFAYNYYIAVAQNKFFGLMLHYFRGKRRMETALEPYGIFPPNPFPCCFVFCCCRNQAMTMRRINILHGIVKLAIYVFPLSYFLYIALILDGLAQNSIAGKVGLFVSQGISNLSLFICMYGFIVAGKASRVALRQFYFRGKFLSLSLLVGINALQKWIIRFVDAGNALPCDIPYPNTVSSYILHSYIFTYEIFIFSLIAWWSYRRSDEGCQVEFLQLPSPCYSSGSDFVEKISLDDLNRGESASNSTFEVECERQNKELPLKSKC